MMTPADIAAAWWRAHKWGELPMITIYERPDEFPDEYVAQLWLIRRGAPVMTDIMLRSASLDESERCCSRPIGPGDKRKTGAFAKPITRHTGIGTVLAND